MDHALGAVLDKGMVGVGAALYRVKAGVNIVPRGRAHGGSLETTGEAYAFLGQLINVGGMGLAAVTTDVPKGAVIGNDEKDIGLVGSMEATGNQYQGE